MGGNTGDVLEGTIIYLGIRGKCAPPLPSLQVSANRSVHPSHKDSLRRRLANALQWYQVLVERAQTQVSQKLAQHLQPQHVAASVATTSSSAPPSNLSAQPEPTPNTSSSSSTRIPPTAPSPRLPDPSPPNNSRPGLNDSRPSAYLRECCPLCFGGGKPNLSESK